MANYVTAEQVTTNNTAHALCVLDNLGYRPTLRICNTYCFSTATMDMPTRGNVKSYLQCLSCLSETEMLFGYITSLRRGESFAAVQLGLILTIKNTIELRHWSPENLAVTKFMSIRFLFTL